MKHLPKLSCLVRVVTTLNPRQLVLKILCFSHITCCLPLHQWTISKDWTTSDVVIDLEPTMPSHWVSGCMVCIDFLLGQVLLSAFPTASSSSSLAVIHFLIRFPVAMYLGENAVKHKSLLLGLPRLILGSLTMSQNSWIYQPQNLPSFKHPKIWNDKCSYHLNHLS